MRRGVALGGGAVLGFAWTVGALRALERQIGIDAREFDMFLGVSAGSIMATLLASGVSTEVLLRQQRDQSFPDDPLVGFDETKLSGFDGRPPRPRLRPGSPQLLVRALRQPGSMRPWAAFSGMFPSGTGSLAAVRDIIDNLLPQGKTWPAHPSLWIAAMDYATGERRIFGRDEHSDVPVADAVAASSAIPGWFAPVEIDGRRYVDGGTISNTSVDVLAGQGLDEVYVLSPMASYVSDNPKHIVGRMERRWRAHGARRLRREVGKVRASGTRVHVITPGPDDLTAMGWNLMDSSRRRNVVETALNSTQLLPDEPLTVLA